MIKTLNKVVMEGMFLDITQAIYDKPTANVILNSENLKAFLLRLGTGQGYPLLPLLQHTIGSPSHSNHTRKKKIKGI